jgi:hypothetical protein
LAELVASALENGEECAEHLTSNCSNTRTSNPRRQNYLYIIPFTSTNVQCRRTSAGLHQ